jgi:benzylsuccinate CoA-transferase BbsF subunit
MSTRKNGLPLSGVRVMDFTWAAAGPVGMRLLALLGADVIKLGTKKRADSLYDPTSPRFTALNTSKRSATLNVADPRGLALAHKLAAISDVVADNFSTGVMERLKLDYETLRAIKPDIICVTSSGMGRTGPKSTELAWGSLLQGYSGWSAVTGYSGQYPHVGSGWTDPSTGITMAMAVMAALEARERTGAGQYIDIAMYEITSGTLVEPLMDYVFNGRSPVSMGNRDSARAPQNVYPCKGTDEWVAVTVNTNEEWKALCKAIGQSKLANDPRFDDALGRKEREAEIDSIITQWTLKHTQVSAMNILQKAGVAAGASYRMSAYLEDPHYQARGFLHEYEGIKGNKELAMSVPWKVNGKRPVQVRRAPAFGEDNEYVFQDLLGVSKDEYETLVKEQVIY